MDAYLTADALVHVYVMTIIHRRKRSSRLFIAIVIVFGSARRIEVAPNKPLVPSLRAQKGNIVDQTVAVDLGDLAHLT